jgi:hypothetical protein
MWRHHDEPAARLDRSGSHSPPRVRPGRQGRLPRHASSKADERATSLNVRQDPPYSGTSDPQASERARPTPARAVPLQHLAETSLVALVDATFSDPVVCPRDSGTTMSRTSTYLGRASEPG